MSLDMRGVLWLEVVGWRLSSPAPVSCGTREKLRLASHPLCRGGEGSSVGESLTPAASTMLAATPERVRYCPRVHPRPLPPRRDPRRHGLDLGRRRDRGGR